MATSQSGVKMPRLWCDSIKVVVSRIIVDKGEKSTSKQFARR